MADQEIWKWIVGTLFSGLGTALWIRYRDSKKADGNSKVVLKETCEELLVKKEAVEDYKTLLGKRHKLIRRNFLDLSDRRMADFYGLETVSELLEFESGVSEFPKSLLNKLSDFFFLKEELFDLDSPVNFPFKTYSLSHREIEKYFEMGFSPVIACAPEDRDTDLYCSIMLSKKENEFYRVMTSGSNGRFRSNHGGKNNIEQLIHAMIKVGKYDTEARIVQVDKEIWSKIELREFSQNIENYELDWDCQDIFDKWFYQYDRKFGNELRNQWIEEHKLKEAWD